MAWLLFFLLKNIIMKKIILLTSAIFVCSFSLKSQTKIYGEDYVDGITDSVKSVSDFKKWSDEPCYYVGNCTETDGPGDLTYKLWANRLTKRYPLMNLIDFNLNTAWVCNIGDTLSIQQELDSIDKIDRPKLASQFSNIIITNGYTKSDKLWKQNARIKKVGVLANGKHIKSIELQDTFLPQVIDFDLSLPVGSTVSLVIEEKYKGTKYKDICVSDFVMHNGYLLGGLGIKIK